jgi:Zn-dependent peptidase ImmA (M78 family)
MADKLSMSHDEWLALEAGIKPVNLTVFKRLSDRLRIPRATLLRQDPPNVPPMPIDFRTILGRPPSIGFDARLAISYAYTIEQNILELVDAGGAPPTPVLPTLTRQMNAVEAGEQERRRIGVPAATQIGWQPKDAFRNWRTIIEATGVYVLLKKFSLEDTLGFTIYRDANAPIIVINKAEQNEAARTFTLLHEYAHLLLRQPGISDQNDANPVEAFCNKFASGFLIPRAVLSAILPYWPAEPVEWDIDLIRSWARRLKVSQRALALRLEQLGVAPVGYYGRLLAMQRKEVKKPQKPGGNYVLTQVNELGDRYTGTVLSAQRSSTITTVEASDMLDIAPRHFPSVKNQIDQQNQRLTVGAV